MCFRKKNYNNDLTTGNQRGDTSAGGQKKTGRELRKSAHRERHRRHQRRDDDTLRDVAHTMPEYDAEKEAAGMLKKIEEIQKREAELQSEWESRKMDSQTSNTQTVSGK